MEIKAGDVLFVWGNSWIETAIEEITHGPSHCALFLDSETLIEAQGGKLSGKVPLSEYLESGARLEVWRDPTLTNTERKEMVDYALNTQIGIHYDYLAILGEFLRFELQLPLKHWKEGDKRICSSFVCGIASSVHHKWTNAHLPAPYDVWADGFLNRIGGLSNAGTATVYRN